MQKLQAVLFDLDGTLIDTAPDLVAAVNQVLREEGYPEQDIHTLRTRAYGGSNTLLGHTLNLDTNSVEFLHLKNKFLAYYAERSTDNAQLFPGMAELLDELDRNDIVWGIVTNKPENLTFPVLKFFGLDTRSACVVCGDTLEHSKPHPAPILHACELINIKPQLGLYVGDSKVDMQAAQAADMTRVLAHYGYLPENANLKEWPNHLSIQHASELSAIVREYF